MCRDVQDLVHKHFSQSLTAKEKEREGGSLRDGWVDSMLPFPLLLFSFSPSILFFSFSFFFICIHILSSFTHLSIPSS